MKWEMQQPRPAPCRVFKICGTWAAPTPGQGPMTLIKKPYAARRPATDAVLDPYALPVGIPAHLVADAAAAGALSRLWFAHLGTADAPAPAMAGGALKPAGSPFQGLELGAPLGQSASGRMYRAVHNGKEVAVKVCLIRLYS